MLCRNWLDYSLVMMLVTNSVTHWQITAKCKLSQILVAVTSGSGGWGQCETEAGEAGSPASPEPGSPHPPPTMTKRKTVSTYKENRLEMQLMIYLKQQENNHEISMFKGNIFILACVIIILASCWRDGVSYSQSKQGRSVLLLTIVIQPTGCFLAPTGALGVKMLSVRASVRPGHYSN